jgi:glycosyltransferase involved in cell wall biosynthesis
MTIRKILYIDTNFRGMSVNVFLKALRQVVDVDTLIIGGTKAAHIPATYRVKTEEYGMPYYWKFTHRTELPFFDFHPLMKALLEILPNNNYDGIIAGTYGLGLPLYALELQGMTGLYTHDPNLFAGYQKVDKVMDVDNDLVSMFRAFHFIPQLQSTARKLIAAGHPQERVHIMPIPAFEYPIVVKEEYDFSSLVMGDQWENAALLNKLVKKVPARTWTIRTCGEKEVLEPYTNVNHVTGFIQHPQYDEWLAMGRVGVQPQLVETFGMWLLEHALFHPVMILEGTNFVSDFPFAVQFNENNFYEKAEALLNNSELRKEITAHGRENIVKNFSFDVLKRGMDEFLDACSSTAVDMKKKVCAIKEPKMNVGEWFR